MHDLHKPTTTVSLSIMRHFKGFFFPTVRLLRHGWLLVIAYSFLGFYFSTADSYLSRYFEAVSQVR